MLAASTVTIGGSEAAAACGVDPYRSRVALWTEKVGLAAPTGDNEPMLWGRLLQPVIAEEIVRRDAYELLPAPADALIDPERPWCTGHPDAYVADRDGRGRGVLEIKTTGAWTAGLWKDDEAPVAYVLQSQQYMHLAGLGWALLAVLIGGQRLELRTLERDDGLIGTMLALEEEFVGFCAKGEPPPPDGSEQTDAMLRRLYPRTRGGACVELTAADYAAVKELKARKVAVKAAEEQAREIEQGLKMRLGDAEFGDYAGAHVLRWQTIERHDPPREERVISYRRFSVL